MSRHVSVSHVRVREICQDPISKHFRDIPPIRREDGKHPVTLLVKVRKTNSEDEGREESYEHQATKKKH